MCLERWGGWQSKALVSHLCRQCKARASEWRDMVLDAERRLIVQHLQLVQHILHRQENSGLSCVPAAWWKGGGFGGDGRSGGAGGERFPYGGDDGLSVVSRPPDCGCVGGSGRRRGPKEFSNSNNNHWCPWVSFLSPSKYCPPPSPGPASSPHPPPVPPPAPRPEARRPQSHSCRGRCPVTGGYERCAGRKKEPEQSTPRESGPPLDARP